MSVPLTEHVATGRLLRSLRFSVHCTVLRLIESAKAGCEAAATEGLVLFVQAGLGRLDGIDTPYSNPLTVHLDRIAVGHGYLTK